MLQTAQANLKIDSCNKNLRSLDVNLKKMLKEDLAADVRSLVERVIQTVTTALDLDVRDTEASRVCTQKIVACARHVGFLGACATRGVCVWGGS